jgi:tetratricopeptide (TPR) repeat protein
MSQSWETLTSLAESAARGGRYAEAKDCYKQALADAVARNDVHNAYYTLCNLAGLLRLLDELGEAEQLLRQATQLRYEYPQKVAREPISPITDLERILVKQNRLSELEQLHLTDGKKMLDLCGKDSFEYKMSLMNLAKIYGTHLKDMEKCRLHFREVLDWARTAEPITCKMVYMSYDSVLRAAGLGAEADALQGELAVFRNQSKT